MIIITCISFTSCMHVEGGYEGCKKGGVDRKKEEEEEEERLCCDIYSGLDRGEKKEEKIDRTQFMYNEGGKQGKEPLT